MILPYVLIGLALLLLAILPFVTAGTVQRVFCAIVGLIGLYLLVAHVLRF